MRGAARRARWPLLALALAGGAPVAGAQPASRAPIPPDSLERAARRLIAAVPFPALVTRGADGAPQARPVQPRLPDSSWTVWLATNPRTRKVAEVTRDPRVVLHYFDPATLGYVTLHGRARVVRDAAEQAAHWDPAWDRFYPDRERGAVLLAVRGERLELVSAAWGIEGDAATWRPPTVMLRRRAPAGAPPPGPAPATSPARSPAAPR
ncbi:MAG: pyridoxamine 5'-phosphate oxidase family protein [Gemmatimonadetes bacterium]|nr:pyridoxamine 5'-phosphate oxidase family protein [Gemmatimonadota bacterium]